MNTTVLYCWRCARTLRAPLFPVALLHPVVVVPPNSQHGKPTQQIMSEECEDRHAFALHITSSFLAMTVLPTSSSSVGCLNKTGKIQLMAAPGFQLEPF
jgi:hypothetical protein